MEDLILNPSPDFQKQEAATRPITWASRVIAGAEVRNFLAPPPPSCLWVPTPLNRGPAPIALAGAECVTAVMLDLATKPDLCTPDRILNCIRLSVTMTRLARAMVQEAAGAFRSAGSGGHPCLQGLTCCLLVCSPCGNIIWMSVCSLCCLCTGTPLRSLHVHQRLGCTVYCIGQYSQVFQMPWGVPGPPLDLLIN
jgi:hypothetical protein